MAQNITLMGASYSDVPAVQLPKTGGGTATFTDVTDTTATASDVVASKKLHLADGSLATGSIPIKGSSDVTVNKASVLAPSGYYPDGANNTVTVMTPPSGTSSTATSQNNLGTISRSTADQYLNLPEGYLETSSYYKIAATPNGTQGTPVATKGSVVDHAMRVHPSVTNTAGYITGGTQEGQYIEVAASEVVSGSETKTANGTYDVTNLAQLVVNVSGGGGGGLTLLQTTALGTLSTSSTSAADTGKTVSLASSTNWQNYDLLLVDISVDTTTNGRHTSTVTPVILTGTSNVSTKNTYTVGSNKWNSKLGSTGTASTRQSTTAYGVYINAASVSSNTLTLTVYYRYNSNSTGTLNGTYTARVYGIKLIDLIGG